MMIDPEFATIEQKKTFGIWPPSDMAAHGVWPYIQRLKKPTVNILDVGCMLGENACFLLDQDSGSKKKIEKIYCIHSFASSILPEAQATYRAVFDQNIAARTAEERKRIVMLYPKEKLDVVCVHHKSNLDKSLNDYYDAVLPNGIVCGTEHGSTEVKEALGRFRRNKKIGTPINVSNGCWFWYKRG
jgi:hypothetical protein